MNDRSVKRKGAVPKVEDSPLEIDLYCLKNTEYYQYDRHHQEQAKQELGDRCSPSGNPGKPKDRRHNSNNKSNQSPIK